jgi:hypothetical protein
MKCIDEWDEMLSEEGAFYLLASTGASALLTAYILLASAQVLGALI